MNRLIRGSVIGLFALVLTACGTTSGMKRSGATDGDKAAEKAAISADFQGFTRVSVQDFQAALSNPSKDSAKLSVQEGQATAAGKRFADQIAEGLTASKAFAEVVRNDPKPGDLLIQGEVTKFKQGSRVARALIGFGAGSANFDATVRFVDGTDQRELSQMIVDKNSWFLGGLMAAAQDADDFLEGAAEKIAEETIKAKTGANK
jgi:hypothetical protein